MNYYETIQFGIKFFLKKIFKQISNNKLLTLILFTSFFLNLWGLYPNTLFHPDEPGVQIIADKLIDNILFHFNFDPNLEPHPFKYASFVFYTQALARGILIIISYPLMKFAGLNLGFSSKVIAGLDFKYYVENASYFIGLPLLLVSRFVNVLYGVGCVLLIYLICQKIFKNKYISLLSSFALATMPLHVRDSHFSTANIPMVFFILLSFLFSVKLYQKPDLKNYILAGVATGFASAIKYYPLPLLPLFLYCLMAGWRIFIKRFLILFFSIALGYVIAMPYVFIHYDKILAFIPFVMEWQAPDQLDTNRSLLNRFLPTYLHQFHLMFLYSEGILPITSLVGLFGLIIGFVKHKKNFILVSLVPVVHFIFINFYIKQIYEYQPLVILPFFAIFIGIGVYYILVFARSFLKSTLLFIVFGSIIFLAIFLSPFIYSLKVDIACAQDITDFQARDWIIKNIPEKTKVAYHPGTRHPSIEMQWIPSEILGNFSLTELQDKDAKYLIAVNGYYGLYTLWSTDLFKPPTNPDYNQYPNLAIEDIKRQSVLLKAFDKPHLCLGNSVYIYKLPERQKAVSIPVFENSINSLQDYNQFTLLDKNEETEIKFVKEKEFSAISYKYSRGIFNKYRDTYFYYTTPLFTQYIEARSSKKYTASANFKLLQTLSKTQKDGYLRIDFYTTKNGPPLLTALSKKGENKLNWQTLKITAKAPEGTNLIRVGFQSLGTEKNAEFLIDDVKLFSD